MKKNIIESGVNLEGRFTNIQSAPPFLNYLKSISNRDKLALIIAASHKLDPRWIGWQTTRKCGLTHNHLTLNFGTGMEGYGFYHANSQEEAAEYILGIGMQTIKTIMLKHKHDWKKRSQLEKTIRGEGYSIAAIQEWFAIFGSIIAREKMSVLTSKKPPILKPKSDAYLARFPKINYEVSADGQITQKYQIPITPTEPNNLGNLSDEKDYAWTIVQNIGMLGHPLIRSAMHNG